MNYRMISSTLGRVIGIEAVLLLLPLATAAIYGENIYPFLYTIVITAAFSGLLLLFKPRTRELYSREGFVIVALSWILMSAFGALPFVFSGDIPRYIDAFFETVSGFTTTGASILPDVEAMGRGCMFWRCFTHWVGGMGVLVFMMAVLPMSGEHSMHILRAEVPGPTVGKLVPRARKTARILYVIYMVMTAILVIMLCCGGMSLFDSLMHSFATAGTGGFSNYAKSVGAFNSAYVDIVITVFMLLFAVNFNLYFYAITGKLRAALGSRELWVFTAVVLFAGVTIGVNIAPEYGGFFPALRYSFFQVGTIISTTGFATTDFNLWPQYSRWVLVLLMFIGACAGSTGGGIKVSRIMLLCKSSAAEIGKLLHPRSVQRVRLDGRVVDDKTIQSASSFFFLYMFILLLTTLLLTVDGFDMETNFTAVLSCLSNIGPGLSLVGPTGSFAMFSDVSKIALSACMLLGRLEIFPILILFVPSLWAKR